MQTLKRHSALQISITALVLALALMFLGGNTLLAAPLTPRTPVRAHSETWQDTYFDQNTSSRIVSSIAETTPGTWRGGMAEQHALNSVTRPHKAVRVIHGDDWNSHYFDRNVNTGIKSITTELFNPALQQGCHAQKDHRVQPSPLVLAIPAH